MTRAIKTDWKPGDPVPMMIDLAHAAALVSSQYFEIAPSALIKWPLVWVENVGAE